METRHKSGVFTLSLDCEGLWGMADRQKVVDAQHITAATLDVAYSRILETLEQNALRCTAAFVSAFAAPPEALNAAKPLFETMRENSMWFENIVQMMAVKEKSGWEGHEYWKRFKAEGHEMAWHGASHLSLGDDTSDILIESELKLAMQLFKSLGHRPTSIVFPRNVVGHLSKLRAAGFNTYRTRATSSKIISLARECNIYDAGDDARPEWRDGWNVIPAGFFLNWPSGVRSLVPPQVTVARWRSMLRTAVEHGRHVHMWFHPHNLITAAAMYPIFTEVMREVGSLVRSGDLCNLTMLEAGQAMKATV